MSDILVADPWPMPGAFLARESGAVFRGDSSRRANRQELADAESQMRLFCDGMPAPLAYLDRQQRYVFVNQAYADWVGQSAAALTGKTLAAVLPSADYDLIRPYLERALRGEPVSYERMITYRNGEQRWMDVRYIARFDERGAVIGTYALFIDIHKQKEAEKALQFLSTHDPHTRLPNRNALGERLPRAIDRAQRSGRSVAVLFIQLDRFKVVNESLGHAMGDALLRVVADRLRRALGEPDTLAHFGGDAFVAVLEDLADARQGERVARELRVLVGKPAVIDGHQLFPTASIGISIYPIDGTDADTLLRKADAALDRARTEGRQGIAYFIDEMNQALAARVGLESALRQALERNEFELHYQPKISLRTGKLAGVEALLRWNRPGRGLVPPDEFLPLAAETDLLGAIGEWVITAAARQAGAWKRRGFDAFPIAINLSAQQLGEPDLSERLASLLRAQGQDAADFEFEVTETALQTCAGEEDRALRSLKNLHARIAIDDFGTGYSNLNRLKLFPVDALKIDKSFVQQIGVDGDYAAIVEAVIRLAHSLKLKVIAEGVETATQERFLREQGCDAYQGHYFCPALPAKALEARFVP